MLPLAQQLGRNPADVHLMSNRKAKIHKELLHYFCSSNLNKLRINLNQEERQQRQIWRLQKLNEQLADELAKSKKGWFWS